RSRTDGNRVLSERRENHRILARHEIAVRPEGVAHVKRGDTDGVNERPIVERIRNARLRILGVLLILRTVWKQLVTRVAMIAAFRDALRVPQRRERLDVDPALVSVVYAEEGNATIDHEGDVIGEAAANRVDSLH